MQTYVQPYMGYDPPDEEQQDSVVEPVNFAQELRNAGLIVIGFALVLLLLPPQHEYPIIDDWIYAGSVRDFLDHGVFIMPPQTQANLVGLTLWGVAWCKLLGFGVTSFTILTYSTLFMSLAALLSLYALARLVGVRPASALFAAALLGLNPIFLHLSYSFMTDVPFVALVLSASFFYILGLQGNGRGSHAWLWLAGILSGWAFLIRQFGVLLPLAFLFYLLLQLVLDRRWRPWHMLSVVALPAFIIGGWYLWSRGIPATPAALQASSHAANFVLRDPWLRVFLIRTLTIMPLLALFLLGAHKLRASHLWLVPAWAAIIVLVIARVFVPGEGWTQIYEPPFRAQFGPLSVDMPLQLYTFGVWGNIIRIDGIDFFEYRQQAIWPADAWWALWTLAMGLLVLMLAKMTGSLFDWLRVRIRRAPRPPLQPITCLYLLGLMTFMVSLGLLGDLYDRYALGFLPFLLIFVARGSAGWGKLAWRYALVALVVFGGVSLLLKADAIDHDNARWQAAQWVQARTGGLHAGYDWDNWVGGRNDTYEISDLPAPDMREEHRFPYFSRLAGFTTRYVIAQSHSSAPPLPNP